MLSFLCWQTALLLSSPPPFQLAGRYSLEPAGTGCTLDYWHGGFANYVPYVFALTLVGFCLPVSATYFVLHNF